MPEYYSHIDQDYWSPANERHIPEENITGRETEGLPTYEEVYGNWWTRLINWVKRRLDNRLGKTRWNMGSGKRNERFFGVGKQAKSRPKMETSLSGGYGNHLFYC